MASSKPAERVVKGWYVEAKFPDDKVPHQISRVYHVRESAMTYAAELRKAASRRPGKRALAHRH
jgi:hypothetical protein